MKSEPSTEPITDEDIGVLIEAAFRDRGGNGDPSEAEIDALYDEITKDAKS